MTIKFIRMVLFISLIASSAYAFCGPTSTLSIVGAQQHHNQKRVIKESVIGGCHSSSWLQRTKKSTLLSSQTTPPYSQQLQCTSTSLAMATDESKPTTIILSHQITTKVGKSASSLVSLSFFILLAYKRDAIILTLWIGAIGNAILSKVIKRILNHERPAELHDDDNNIKLKPSDGGMPSSHAMSLGFIGTSILFGIIPQQYQVGAGVVMSIYTALALQYRIQSKLHTLEQVIVGLVLGIGNALTWLKFGLGSDGSIGCALSYVQSNFVSPTTGLFPCSALSIPIVVGILVVGSFERRIALWLKNKKDR